MQISKPLLIIAAVIIAIGIAFGLYFKKPTLPNTTELTAETKALTNQAVIDAEGSAKSAATASRSARRAADSTRKTAEAADGAQKDATTSAHDAAQSSYLQNETQDRQSEQSKK